MIRTGSGNLNRETSADENTPMFVTTCIQVPRAQLKCTFAKTEMFSWTLYCYLNVHFDLLIYKRDQNQDVVTKSQSWYTVGMFLKLLANPGQNVLIKKVLLEKSVIQISEAVTFCGLSNDFN